MKTENSSRVDDVAQWMLKEVTKREFLDQESTAFEIEQTFGSDFVYLNENGNPAIAREVLDRFRDLSGEAVVWESGDRLWRFRKDYDPPGRDAG